MISFRHADGKKQFDVKMLPKDQRLLSRKARLGVPGRNLIYRSINNVLELHNNKEAARSIKQQCEIV